MSRKRLDGPIDPELANQMHRKASTYTLLLHQLIAEHLKLNPTDHKVLDFMHTAGPEPPLTAGRLPDITGLSSGAITGVLDAHIATISSAAAPPAATMPQRCLRKPATA